MRLIDADALSAFVGDLRSTLHKEQSTFKAMTDIEFNTRDYMLLNFQYTIDNAPTVCNDNYSMGYQDGVRKVLSERSHGERWIPVSERLPDIAKKCIVQLTDGHITIGSYHSINRWTFQETSVRYAYPKESVIAWMPLPEPYKEAENE